MGALNRPAAEPSRQASGTSAVTVATHVLTVTVCGAVGVGLARLCGKLEQTA